ncbi:MAG: hypothetical protein AAFY45_27445 [Bacteroidota bacterium]
MGSYRLMMSFLLLSISAYQAFSQKNREVAETEITRIYEPFITIDFLGQGQGIVGTSYGAFRINKGSNTALIGTIGVSFIDKTASEKFTGIGLLDRMFLRKIIGDSAIAKINGWGVHIMGGVLIGRGNNKFEAGIGSLVKKQYVNSLATVIARRTNTDITALPFIKIAYHLYKDSGFILKTHFVLGTEMPTVSDSNLMRLPRYFSNLQFKIVPGISLGIRL